MLDVICVVLRLVPKPSGADIWKVKIFYLGLSLSVSSEVYASTVFSPKISVDLRIIGKKNRTRPLCLSSLNVVKSPIKLYSRLPVVLAGV